MIEKNYPPPLVATDALFLDFDGTLAPIQQDPDSVRLPEDLARLVEDVAAALDGALAILSGRDVDDLNLRVPHALWRFGNHGLRSSAPGKSDSPPSAVAPQALKERMQALASRHEGARVEEKGAVLALHYRQAPHAQSALDLGMQEALADLAGYRLQHGKMVFEAKPETANKGHCLGRAMQMAPFAGRRPVMIGDDTTDEDAFRMALELDGVAVKVGEGHSVAPWRLQSTAAVQNYLQDFMDS